MLHEIMIFRNAVKKDIGFCLQISKQDNEQYWIESDFSSSITNENSIFIVVEEKKEIIGYILGFIVPTKEDEAMIHESRIVKVQRGKKVGTKLVNEFCQEAFKRGVKIVYAMIESELEKFYINSCRFEKTGHWIEASKRLNGEK
jgi:N-acetylglutamate synthase-like GNAT family acetyltransferase